MLRPLLRLQTGVHRYYVSDSAKVLRTMLEQGKLDNISVITGSEDCEGYAGRCMNQGRLYLMINRAHPLARRKSVSIQDLKGVPFVSQGEEYDMHNLLSKACQDAGFALNVVYCFKHTYELIEQVNAGVAASYYFLPEIYYAQSEEVTCIPFEPEIPWYYMHMTTDPAFMDEAHHGE